MKLRRFRDQRGDSLDLLLDTICNAFGGIVLIAILITLLTRDARKQLEASATQQDRDVVQRQIASLKEDIEEAKAYLARQAGDVSLDPALSAGRRDAKTRLETAKSDNKNAWVAWKSAAAKASGEDPEADEVLGQKVAISSRLAGLKTEEEALVETDNQLMNRLQALKQQRSDIVSSKAEQLRLPKEGSSSSVPTYFILRFNEVFPMHIASGSRWVENRTCFDWQDIGEDTLLAPIKGKGLSPDSLSSSTADSVALTKREGSYAALLVAPDSVQAYRQLKKVLVSAGVQFGWRVRDRSPYSFGSNGSSPPPL